MSSSKSSKLLPIIAFVIAGIGLGGFLIYQEIKPSGNNSSLLTVNSDRVKNITVDADLPADTLNTLAQKSATIEDKFKNVDETITESNAQLREMRKMFKDMADANHALREQLEQQNRKMEVMENAVGEAKTVDYDSIKNSVMEAITGNIDQILPQEAQTNNTNDYPISEQPIDSLPLPETRSRIRSYGVPVDENGQIPGTYLQQLNDKGENSPHPGTESRLSSASETDTVSVDPRYTIPADAVLNDSVTVTALIGRIPKDGNIGDPAPFKVAIGRDNLAANGFSIPGLDGMIMSGVVYGDSVRKCVITKLRRATYIFEDGRILTLPKALRTLTGLANSQTNTPNVNSGRTIGYLTDPYGDPCIKGTYISNGNAQIAKTILANMASGAANASAQTQTTSLVSDSGNVVSTVTGNDTKFVMGSAISEGAKSVASYLQSQTFDSWDQIVVPVGKSVVIHIDEPLEIDNASNLRKLVYGQENNHFGLTD